MIGRTMIGRLMTGRLMSRNRENKGYEPGLAGLAERIRKTKAAGLRRERGVAGARGFTLVETLCATLILALMGIGLTTMLGASLKVYNTSMFVSNSEILEDTLDETFSDMLRHATDPHTVNGALHFKSSKYYGLQDGGRIEVATQADQFYIVPDDEDADQNMMINSGAYAGMHIQNWSLTYEDGVYIGSYKIVSGNGKYDKTCTFKYRSLTEAVADED